MTQSYENIVAALCEAFPQPVSDRVHDAYFVFSLLRALDQVDALKSARPMLGSPVELDFEAARDVRMAEESQSVEDVSEKLVGYFSGTFIWGHPRSQINVIATPTIPSVIGGVLPAIYNPNLCSDESSRKLAVAEVEVTAMTADLVGYDADRAGGFFTFGGTGTLLYGIKLGLEKACPGTAKQGVREPAVILCSERAHYACLTAANWLGLGEASVITVPAGPDNDIRTCLLETRCRELLESGTKIAAIVATMGTTDAFGIDDLCEIVDIRDRLADEFSLDYRPHVHADAVIGWAWSVFNDYDLDANPLEFGHRTIRAIAGAQRRITHLGRSDTLGIDFHKTGFTPYVSSLFLTADAGELSLIARNQEATPYLFQSGHHHPGKYTLETSRSASGPLAALANLLLFGKDGLRALLGHLITMAEVLREHLQGGSATHVMNSGNFGPVTLFRVYPDGVDTFSVPRREQQDSSCRDQLLAHNAYNRRVFELIQQEALQGNGVIISMTDCYRESDYGEPIVALKSYVMSPFTTEENVMSVVSSIRKARETIAASG
ncbi:MAG: aspartate aminotransferase family protein [Planctomycetaceae bacterium]|nr:aspartate aminotransferase family protein [Planctomycetaceae bacterium]